ANVMTRHVQQAKGAGIDGFVQSWYGPNASQQTEPNFAQLLNIASANGFTAAVTFEPVNPFLPDNNARISALQTLLATHAQHPAYLRADGRPVIYFWATWALSVDDWRAIRNAADPGYSSIWIAEGGNADYLSVFDGMHIYNVAWSATPGEVNVGIGGRTRAAANTYGGYKYWSAVAMPGFNDSLLGRGDNTIVRDRGDGAFLRNSFNGAVRSNPDFIVITSFNEWPEGSHIEPSAEFGDFYLNLTRELISTYKGGGVPASSSVAAAPAPTQVPQASSSTNSEQAEPTSTSAPVQVAQIQPSPTPRADGKIIHVVQAGDTLYGIASRYGLTLEELLDFNGIEATALLSIGQELLVGQVETEQPTETIELTKTADEGVSQTVVAESTVVEDSAQSEAGDDLPSTDRSSFSLGDYPNTVVRDEDGAILYAVQSGNTIIEIALLYGLTLEDIYSFNNLNETSLLSVGQEIVVGYVPTPSPDLVGGSADLPIQAATETPTQTPVTPSATPTMVTPTLPPLPTATPTSAVISALPTAGPTVVPETIEISQSSEEDADASEGLSNFYLTMFIVSIVILVVSIGLLLVYLGRKSK
ncbi:MAG: endo-1,3-alpha-glucanase family glycosylhydrolase, partial [Chloroflexota bacterium]